MQFVRFFISQRLFVNLLSIILIILGFFSLRSLNRERYPIVDLDLVIIFAIYPGSSPSEMEDLVTTPIEDALKQTDGIKELESYSIDNRAGVVVWLDEDLPNRQAVIDEIRRLVDGIRDFPAEMERPIISEITSRKRSIGTVVISAEKGVSYRELRQKAKLLADNLKEIEGIAEVTLNGYLKREFRVELNPRALKNYNIGTDQIIASLFARNTNLPVGKVVRKGREYILKTPGKVSTADEIGDVVVRANEEGHILLLKKVARVIDGFEDPVTLTRVDGNPTITLTVKKKQKYDTIDSINRIERNIENFKKEVCKKGRFQFRIIDNAALKIQNRINVLSTNAAIGIILVMICLFLFLNWRIALITAFGIPLAFGFTFILMKFMNYNLDLLTLLGLIVVVGMIVDDAIIVAENIYRHMEAGLSPTEAAIKGTGEVIMPVAATILTSIAAFSPLLIMSGIRGKFAFFIAMIVILALASSWLEAMLALPSHVADFGKLEGNPGKLRTIIDRAFSAFREFYTASLELTLKYKIFVMSGVLILIILCMFIIISKRLPFVPFPKEGVVKFMISCKAPQGTTLKETSRRMTEIEKLIDKEIVRVQNPASPEDHEALLSYGTIVGAIQKRPGSRHAEYGNHYAVVLVNLSGHNQRKISGAEIVKNLETKISPIMRRIDMNCTIKKSLTGPAQKDAIELEVIGDDPIILETIKNKIIKIIDVPEKNYTISDDSESQKAVLNIKVPQKILAVLGLSNKVLNTTLRAAYEGVVASSLRIAGEEVKIRVIFPEDKRNKINSLDYVYLTNKRGALIRLSRIIKITKSVSPSKIVHRDWKQTLTVALEPTDKNADVSEIVDSTKELIKTYPGDKYPGYRIKFGGSYKEAREVQSELLTSFYIALLVIFIILVTLFKSFFQPAIVMSAIPLGLIGVVATLLFHGQPMSFMAGVGFIGLVGVAVNDSLVMVEFINNALGETWEKFKLSFTETNTHDEYLNLKSKWEIESRKLVIEGARLRFRPVLLTTITTFFGLLPTAYGLGGDDAFIKPLALVFAWGLFFATANTLLLVPAIYLVYLPVRFRISYRWSRLKLYLKREK